MADNISPAANAEPEASNLGPSVEVAADELERPLLSGPKRQHFLPRFYLDGFARDGLVAVYDRQEDVIRLQQPTNTAVIGHFYTMQDAEGRRRFEIEAFLSDYENKARQVINKLVAGEPDLSADERSDLSIFIALAAMRTPDMVNSVQALNGDVVKHVAKFMFADFDQVFQVLRSEEEHGEETDEELRLQAKWMVQMAQSDGLVVNTDQKWAVGQAIQMALEAAPHLAGRDWRVIHRKTDKFSFVTTDAPVYLNSTTPQHPLYGVGFGSPNAFISFPLHQSCALEMVGSAGRLAHKVVDRDYIRMANIHYARRCQRFVVGRDEALLKSISEALNLANTKWKPKFRSGAATA